jgi:hypothetical protein
MKPIRLERLPRSTVKRYSEKSPSVPYSHTLLHRFPLDVGTPGPAAAESSFLPVSDKRETPTRVADREVLHPTVLAPAKMDPFYAGANTVAVGEPGSFLHRSVIRFKLHC